MRCPARTAPSCATSSCSRWKQPAARPPTPAGTPRHVLLRARGRLARGALPLYLKSHSWGEFVFDFAWAQAYQRAGLRYYPKLVSAVPFTPATGPRLLARRRRAARGAASRPLARCDAGRCRSPRCTSCSRRPHDRETLESRGCCCASTASSTGATTGYATFDDFLAGFTAEKRKKLRRERRRVAEAGIAFRTLTGAGPRRGDHRRRLRPACRAPSCATATRPTSIAHSSSELARVMPESLVVELAQPRRRARRLRDLLARRRHAVRPLLGRERRLPQPAFRALLPPGIEYCISEGLARFEPGTQGEHKIAARLPADARVVGARHRPTRAFARAIGGLARARTGGAPMTACRGRDAPALPARRHPG